jgi:predicted DNA-binding protein (UPF0251 family)/predicted Fe-Mo cluster-binding NifX family protein
VAADFPVRLFKPAGIPGRDLETLTLTSDEVEALRLVDADGLFQEAAARQMGISRPTLGRVLNEARRKTALALSQGYALVINAGSTVVRAGGSSMTVAVPTQGSDVVSHWGHSPEISLYKIPSTESAPFKVLSAQQGCACKSGLAQVLHNEHVTHVLVGQIGAGAFTALQRFVMTVIRGVSGSSSQAIQSLALGQLQDTQELCGHEDCGEDHPVAKTGGFDLRKP